MGRRGVSVGYSHPPVGPGMSFSGRVKAAARNLALVLTIITRQGKIDPAEKKYYGLM